MTPFQLVSSAIAGLFTVYYSQVMFRTKTYAPLTMFQVTLWVTALAVCTASWVGIQ